MEGFARNGTVIDMAKWLHFYTFDTVGAVTVCNWEAINNRLFSDLLTVWQTFWLYGKGN